MSDCCVTLVLLAAYSHRPDLFCPQLRVQRRQRRARITHSGGISERLQEGDGLSRCLGGHSRSLCTPVTDFLSPAFSPIRTRTSVAAIFPCIAAAHSKAFVAEPKEAMKPSPIAFTSDPPCAFNACRVIRSCWRNSCRASASPIWSVSAVEPSTSVKRIVEVSALETDAARGERPRLRGRRKE